MLKLIIMSTTSNLYAERTFDQQDQPISLWALDDKTSYVSFLNANARNLQNWTKNSIITNVKQKPDWNQPKPKLPIDDEYPVEITMTASSGGEGILTSPTVIAKSDLDVSMGSFTISAYFYAESIDIKGLSISIVGYDDTTPTEFVTEKIEDWIFASKTYYFNSTTIANYPTNIAFKLSLGVLSGTNMLAYISGVSVGYWSENFSSSYMGVKPETFSDLSSVNLGETNLVGYPALAYGKIADNGYYIGKKDSTLARRLYASNSVMPMIYGTDSCTKIYSNEQNGIIYPSLILPAHGMFNKIGKNQNRTIEMWLKIYTKTTTPKKIFGPISSTDGLYVHDSLLTLRIGNNFESYFVGEWSRPMLIHILLSPAYASVLVNGFEAISIKLKSSDLTNYKSEFTNGKSNDWLGFYAHPEVPTLNVDCVSIYPSLLSKEIASKKYILGQGVRLPDEVNTAFGGSTVYIDYGSANYAKNFSYPLNSRWGKGHLENLVVSNNSITTPQYELPSAYFPDASKSIDDISSELTSYNEFTTDNSFSLKLSGVSETKGYYYFKKLSLLSGLETKATYVVFTSSSTNKETIFKIKDIRSGQYLLATSDKTDIKYYFYSGSGTETEIASVPYISNNKNIAGIDLDVLAATTSDKNIISFISNRSRLTMSVGGDETFTNSFTGELYSIGFSSSENLLKIANRFTDGFATNATGDADFARLFTATYTMTTKEIFDTVYFEIFTDSYWEDYIPLTYLSKNTRMSDGTYKDNIDFIQFDIGYPQSEIFKTISGQEYYDTDSALVKTYIAFKYLSDGVTFGNTFTNTKGMSKSGTVEPGAEWINTKYEVVDGSIIYLPPEIDLNTLAILIKIEFTVDGINENTININYLELASSSLFKDSSGQQLDSIGTKFGVPLYPFVKNENDVYLYDQKNPILISKNTSPYFFLTNKSGVSLLGTYTPGVDPGRGILIKLNRQVSESYAITSFQLSMKYTYGEFNPLGINIFEIKRQDESSYIRIYIKSISSDNSRGLLYAKLVNNDIETDYSGINFYINGKQTLSPVIGINEWAMFGVSFKEELILDSRTGNFEINGPVIVNNISFYELNEAQKQSQIVTQTWTGVESLYETWINLRDTGVIDDPGTSADESFRTWLQAYFTSTKRISGVAMSDIYNSYTGTNRVVVNSSFTDPIQLSKYQYVVFENSQWHSNVVKVV